MRLGLVCLFDLGFMLFDHLAKQPLHLHIECRGFELDLFDIGFYFHGKRLVSEICRQDDWYSRDWKSCHSECFISHFIETNSARL